MQRKVEGLDNLNRILTLPIGSRFGLFADSGINAFKVSGYTDRVAKSHMDPHRIATILVPTYPLPLFDHADRKRDLVYVDPYTGLYRVLYESDLKGPLMGVPWSLNRAAVLPTYLYTEGAAPCFHACFVFVNDPVGTVITIPVQDGTETFFISMNEINNSQL